MPACSSAPLWIIGCTSTAPPIRWAAACTAASSRRSSAIPPDSVLWARNGALDHDWEAELRRRADRLVGVGRDALGDERYTVGEQQLARVGGSSHASSLPASATVDDAARRIAVDRFGPEEIALRGA
jgi:hypothetical protein